MKIKEDRVYHIVINTILVLMAVACIVPMLILVVSSLSSEQSIAQNGYSFISKEFSLSAYQYLWQKSGVIGNAYLRTIIVTALGTVISLSVTLMLAYPISRRDYPYRGFTIAVVVFAILFNGGLVPTYMVYTNLLNIKNTIWALLIPNLLMNGFNVLITRTYFANNVPSALIESAKIDGAGEFKIFLKIVLPISVPIMATIGLLAGIGYWNDWYNGFIYVTETSALGIQSYLARIIMDLQYLTSSGVSGNTGTLIAQLPTTTVKMAIAVVGIIPVLVIYPFFQRYFVKGITIGSVKG